MCSSKSQLAQYWFRWGTSKVYRFDFTLAKWKCLSKTDAGSRFLFFSSVTAVPDPPGFFFILGGSSETGERSDQVVRFLPRGESRPAHRFERCPSLLHRRGFFTSCYSVSRKWMMVCGGNDGEKDLSECEVLHSPSCPQPGAWRPLPPMLHARNGSACLFNEANDSLLVAGGA